MLAFPCNCSCSSRAQLRNQAPLSGSSPDSLSCCSTEGKRGRAAFVRTKRTLCRAASPSTAKHASSAVEAKSAAPAKQEVVSYNGVEFEVTDKPELKSTWEHRAIVLSTTLVLGLLFARGVSHSSGLAIAACVVVGYVFADFGSGVYHWGVDNYGSGETKLVGSQIAAFQGHHRRPWTITEREFCNNCSLTFKPAGFAGGLFLLLSLTGLTPSMWDVFAATASFFIAMSQQFHAWSHTKKSELPAAVVALQDANVLISRKAHGTHHRSPFNIHYCIVSGWCNPLLDAGLLMSLEQLIRRSTGVEPRGWYEPLAEWRELERGELEA